MRVNGNIVEGLQKYFLLGALAVLLVTLFFFVSSFFSTLLMAAIIIASIYPLHSALTAHAKFSHTFATVLTFVLVLLLIVAPLTVFFFSVINQTSAAFITVSEYLRNIRPEDLAAFSSWSTDGIIDEWLTNLGLSSITMQDIISAARDIARTAGTLLIEQSTEIVRSVSVLIIHLLVFLLAMFYLILDGERLVSYVRSLLPLPDEYREQLFQKIYWTMRSIIFGFFGVAIVQGTLVAIGFSIVGIQNAFFWGAIACIFSVIPFVGTSIIWFPVVLILAFNAEWWSAIFLLLWGMFVVGLSDNLIRPYLIGSGAALHPFMVFIVLIGGVFAFGFAGLIFGPLILTLTLSFLHIYRLEYASVLHPKRDAREVYRGVRI